MAADDYADWSREALIERITELEAQQQRISTTRRGAIAALGAAGAAGLLGVNAVRDVEAAPSGTFPAEIYEALETTRADRVQLIPRSSDPTDIADGGLWYRGDV